MALYFHRVLLCMCGVVLLCGELASQSSIMLVGAIQELYGAAWVYQTFEWICWSDEAFVVVLCGLLLRGWFRVFAACFRALRLCLPRRKKKKKKCKQNWRDRKKKFKRRKLLQHLVRRSSWRVRPRPLRLDGSRFPSPRCSRHRRWRRWKSRQRCHQRRKEEQSAREEQSCSDSFPWYGRVQLTRSLMKATN